MANSSADDNVLLLPPSAEVAVDGYHGNSSKHKRDIHILSAMFPLVFLAYSAAQNLESSLNSALGTTSLGILYLSLTLCSFVATPFVRRFGSRNSLILGTSGYWLFIASNLIPSWYTMVPASLYLGFTASIIWVGEGTYLTSAARNHAAECKLPEGQVLGSFNGEFWGAFASTQIIGNLLSLALLHNKMDGERSGTTLLFVVFLGCMTSGTVLACFLSKQCNPKEDLTPVMGATHSSIKEQFKATFVPLLDKKMLFLVPLLVYSGLEQAFVWAEFTKYVVSPSIGVQGVGGAMAVFGAAGTIFSLLAGTLTTNLLSITIVTSTGIFCQATMLIRLWINHNFESRVTGIVNIMTVAVLWGIGDGILNTQINATLGLLFSHNTEAVFSQLKIWQSGAVAVVFFLSPHITFDAMLILLAVILCIAWAGILTVSHVFEKIQRTPLC